MNILLDLYSDYLLASTGPTTATGLSALLGSSLSHDEFTRFLNQGVFTSCDLWKVVKPLLGSPAPERVQSAVGSLLGGTLIFDDTISEKPYTSENELVTYHFDHAKGHTVRGINILTGFYHQPLVDNQPPWCVPVCYQLVHKDVAYEEARTGKHKVKSSQTKNQRLRAMFDAWVQNHLAFDCVLGDAWFGSSANMLHIDKAAKTFVFELKTNRLAVRSPADRQQGHWTRIDALDLTEHTPTRLYLKGLDLEVVVLKQVFKNENSTGVRYLVSNALDLSDGDLTTLYQRRWGVEVYHKSLKQNASLSKSPTRTVRSQSNHIFAALIAFVKLEKLKHATATNHFAFKAKLYQNALMASFSQLRLFKDQYNLA